MKKILLPLLFALATAMPVSARTPGEVEIGSTLREATMQGLSVPSKKLSEYRGKPLLINVWASWCGPCRSEMGSLERLHRRFGGRQFQVIGISTDDYRDAAMLFVQKTGTTFPTFIDSKLQLENMLGADRMPLTLLIDAQGKVLQKVYGAKEWDSPEALKFIGDSFRLRL
jgi:thiol-disulfide isomerase/thioredoxin